MTQKTRAPAVAGQFYPGSASALQQAVEQYMAQASPPELTDVRAVLAPHAGYVYSGPVAAFAYKLLAQQPEPPQRVYLLGPSHRTMFSGVALGDYEALRTPLGDAPVDTEAVAALAGSDGPFKPLNRAHAAEHCLEVHVPFLQTVFPNVPIVPLLFGQVSPGPVAEHLAQHLEADDLVVVSSDLSHYHDNATAHRVDRQFLDALLAGDPSGVRQGEACGQVPALTLMSLAEARGWEPKLLDYRTSGDVVGNPQQVVGYASVAYVEGA